MIERVRTNARITDTAHRHIKRLMRLGNAGPSAIFAIMLRELADADALKHITLVEPLNIIDGTPERTTHTLNFLLSPESFEHVSEIRDRTASSFSRTINALIERHSVLPNKARTAVQLENVARAVSGVQSLDLIIPEALSKFLLRESHEHGADTHEWVLEILIKHARRHGLKLTRRYAKTVRRYLTAASKRFRTHTETHRRVRTKLALPADSVSYLERLAEQYGIAVGSVASAVIFADLHNNDVLHVVPAVGYSRDTLVHTVEMGMAVADSAKLNDFVRRDDIKLEREPRCYGRGYAMSTYISAHMRLMDDCKAWNMTVNAQDRAIPRRLNRVEKQQRDYDTEDPRETKPDNSMDTEEKGYDLVEAIAPVGDADFPQFMAFNIALTTKYLTVEWNFDGFPFRSSQVRPHVSEIFDANQVAQEVRTARGKGRRPAVAVRGRVATHCAAWHDDLTRAAYAEARLALEAKDIPQVSAALTAAMRHARMAELAHVQVLDCVGDCLRCACLAALPLKGGAFTPPELDSPEKVVE